MQSTWRYITDERNVETAIRRAYSRKSARQKRRKEVREAMNDPEYAHRLAEDIKNGTYRHGGYRHLTIHEIKDRDLSISSYYDRCCQNVLKDAIQPIMVNKCTDDMCAGMPNRGISSRTARWNVIKKMRAIMSLRSTWIRQGQYHGRARRHLETVAGGYEIRPYRGKR